MEIADEKTLLNRLILNGIVAMRLPLSWILNASELSTVIIFASSAALVWKDLKECYDKVDGSCVFSYIERLLHWFKENMKHFLQQHLFQFLMGLNETFSAVRS